MSEGKAIFVEFLFNSREIEIIYIFFGVWWSPKPVQETNFSSILVCWTFWADIIQVKSSLSAAENCISSR